MIAIMPLAFLMGKGTEEIALRTGEAIGGFLNATFGNAAELIIVGLAIYAASNDPEIVETMVTVTQASLNWLNTWQHASSARPSLCFGVV